MSMDMDTDTVMDTISDTDMPIPILSTITAKDLLNPSPLMVIMVMDIIPMPTTDMHITVTDTTILARDPLNPDTDMPTMAITDTLTLMATVVISDMVMASKFILLSILILIRLC